MEEKKLSEFTDHELLDEVKKMKSNNMINAFLIGFLFAIVIYSFVKNTWGFATLFPLYFIYRMVNNSKVKKTELENLLKERNLK
jgi:hypothetical protein